MSITALGTSTTSLTAGYSRAFASSLSEKLSVWRESADSSSDSTVNKHDELILSDLAKAYLAQAGKIMGADENGSSQTGFIKHLLEKTLGVKIGSVDLERIDFSSSSTHIDMQSGSLKFISQTATDPSTQLQTNASAASLTYSSSHYESQNVSFSIERTVRTKDGQELGFKLDLDVSQEFASQTNISAQASQASTSTPLVIDFDGLASQLSDQFFTFAPDSSDSQTTESPAASESQPVATSEVTNTDEASAIVADTTDTGSAPVSHGNRHGHREDLFASLDKLSSYHHAGRNKMSLRVWIEEASNQIVYPS